MYTASNLNKDLKTLHRNYLNAQIFKYNHRNLSIQSLIDALIKKFSYFKASSNYFMLPWLSPLENNHYVSFKQSLNDKEIFFSGKDRNDENSFINNQLKHNSIMIQLKDNSSIRIIDTFNGGVFIMEPNLCLYLFLELSPFPLIIRMVS